MKKQEILIDLKVNFNCLKSLYKQMETQKNQIKKVEEFNILEKECSFVEQAINTLETTIFLLR